MDQPRSAFHGTVIAIARPRSRAGALGQELEQLGAEVVYAPAIAMAPPGSWAALDMCLERLNAYHWLIFTSAYAVDATASRLRFLGISLPPALRIAAVGPTTARCSQDKLGRANVVGDKDAAALADLLPIASGDRALFVCGARARTVLPESLITRGVQLDRAVGYRTVPTELVEFVQFARTRQVSAIILSSPSTAEAFARALHQHGLSFPLAIAIGATTARAALTCGFDVAAVAANPSNASVLDATIAWRSSSTRHSTS